MNLYNKLVRKLSRLSMWLERGGQNELSEIGTKAVARFALSSQSQTEFDYVRNFLNEICKTAWNERRINANRS